MVEFPGSGGQFVMLDLMCNDNVTECTALFGRQSMNFLTYLNLTWST